jgi:hypothetical protein
MAYYQGVLRELHDQRAMLATPKEMRALFDADPSRFASPGSVKIAFSRYARDRDPQAAARAAARTVQAWRALPAPVTEAAVRGITLPSEPGVESILAVLDVALGQEGTPALKAFAPLCKPGDVSDPVQDEGWVSVMLCLERTEGAEAVFADAAVQEKLRKEIADRRWSQIAARLFPEDRVGVKRLPWGEPDAMERRRR